MTVERVANGTGVITTLNMEQALKLIEAESRWVAFAAEDWLIHGNTLKTGIARYVLLT